MGEFTHMKEKMSFFFFPQRKHQNFYEKTFSLETLEARGLFFFLLISGPLFLPSVIHLVNTQHAIIK